jgi:glutaminase
MKPKSGASPIVSPVLDFLHQLHREISSVKDGAVATYIPELAKANPDWLGICLVTASGTIYEVGDTRQEFTIQSISKPFVYGLALEDIGRAAILQKVGVEPTGDAFNSISLDPVTGRPRNPMINAGAIATAGLIAGKTPAAAFKRILETFSLYAGHPLRLESTVYRSESETGHRNRAIGHMLRNFDKITGDPAAVTDLYFQQCSISVHCRDLAVMAATLANCGVNPLTGKRALRGEYVESVLSVMGTCGMYDYAGEWLYNVGIPAKSGVAGGVLAVLPGQFGIGVFSPRLDVHGNSVRGIRVCQELSRRLDLHLFNRAPAGKSAVRVKFTGAEFNSSHVRHPLEECVLRESANAIQAYQLQGNLSFIAIEAVVQDVLQHHSGLQFLIFDLRRVMDFSESAGHLFHSLVVKLAALDRAVIFTSHQHLPLLRRMMKSKLGAAFDELFHSFADNDLALEWCEDQLLEKNGDSRVLGVRLKIADYLLFKGLSAAELSVVQPLLTSRSYPRGAEIISAGDAATEIFFLSRGVLSLYLPGEERHRLASFSPGMSFGEMAFIDGSPRSANIVADNEAECHELSRENFDALGRSHPALKIKLLERLCLDLTGKLRKANREIDVLE